MTAPALASVDLVLGLPELARWTAGHHARARTLVPLHAHWGNRPHRWDPGARLLPSSTPPSSSANASGRGSGCASPHGLYTLFPHAALVLDQPQCRWPDALVFDTM